MTKAQIVLEAVREWRERGLPDPSENKYDFIRSLINRGDLPIHQALPAGAKMVRNALRVVETEAPGAHEQSPLVRTQERHTYLDGVYTFYPSKKKPFTIREHHVQEMKRAYSNKSEGGLGWTINQVCKHFKIGRPEFTFIKSELGWTHDQDEFTREEHLGLTTEQLLDDREQRSRWELDQKQRQKDTEELMRLAHLGQDFEARTEALQMALANHMVIRPPKPKKPSPRALVIPMSDLHLGAPGTSEVEQAIFGFLGSLPLEGRDVFLVWNGDLFHVDTPANTTTKGTRQEVANHDSYQTLADVYRVALGAQEFVADRAGSLMTVGVPGNHDQHSMSHFHITLKLLGYDVDDQAGEGLKAIRWHDELFVFEHGDGGRGKAENHLLAITNRFRKLIGQTLRTWLWTGHLHHVKQLDVAGAMHFQLSSPEHSSAWARKNGYEGMRLMQAFEFEHGRGLIRQHWAIL